MIPLCTKSKDGRHNFAITGADCANGCGLNQAELSGGMKRVPKNDLSTALNRVLKPKVDKGIHTPLHSHIKDMMREFGEPPYIIDKNGKKVRTFVYYLGRLSKAKVPDSLLWQWRSEIRQSPDIKSPSKIFWWKFRQWKNQKGESSESTKS
jgi:hypothetical protein